MSREDAQLDGSEVALHSAGLDTRDVHEGINKPDESVRVALGKAEEPTAGRVLRLLVEKIGERAYGSEKSAR